jgi:hypothetical protein
MFQTRKPSSVYPVAGAIPPQSVAAAGNATTGATYLAIPICSKWLLVRLITGALGGGSEQVDVLQAKDTAGTGSKPLVTGLRITAVNNTQFDDEINIDSLLDTNNGFAFIQVKITNTGGTGALVAAHVAFGPNEFMS